MTPDTLVSESWQRVRSHVFPYAALVDGVHWVVLRLNEFPEHPLYTVFFDGERLFDLDQDIQVVPPSRVRATNPKLRVLKMPRPPLACAFAPGLAAVSGYFRS